MFCKNWTKKEWLRCLLCFVIYFALILVSELPGYASPLYWVLSVTAGMISERLSEKILKMEEPERPIYLHNGEGRGAS